MAYRTSPAELQGMPPGVPHIIGNEAAERFSFYGMKAVLAVFMANYLHYMGDTVGTPMSEAAASEKVHFFNFWVYITPFLGALISDIFFGKYRTIITLSLVYVAGHAALAFMGIQGDARMWLFLGLALIALGSGGIKPCVSAHVGDQFGTLNAHLLPRVFNWFYFSINLGAMVSMLLTPWLLEWHGPHWAFGVPGVLMALATLVFWMGRHRFIHVPAGGRRFVDEISTPEGWQTLLRLLPIYILIAVFWALFDQTGSRWIFQAQDMDRNFLGFEWLPSQVQSLNSFFILAFIPLFTYLLYPSLSKIWTLTPLRKIGLGLFLMAASFGFITVVQSWIDAGKTPNIGWQVLAYILLSAAEVMVSITALEFAYTQAPRTMKSLVMCFYLGAVAFGNIFTAGINHFIQIETPFEGLEAMEIWANDAQVRIPRLQQAGYDGEFGTSDDLFSTDGRIDSPVRPDLEVLLADLADQLADAPRLPAGLAIPARLDPWGNPYRLTVLNSRTVRVASAGPDEEFKTPWDLGFILELPAEQKKREGSWLDSLRPEEPWLARRKAEIAAKEGETAPEDEFPFAVTYYAGGGTHMEGTAYFRFFTLLMLGAAVLFIPFALLYREKTHLQE